MLEGVPKGVEKDVAKGKEKVASRLRGSHRPYLLSRLRAPFPPWPSPGTAIVATAQQPQTPVLPEGQVSQHSATAAALAGHAELIAAVCCCLQAVSRY